MSKRKIISIISSAILTVAAIVTITGVPLKDLWTNTNNDKNILHNTSSPQHSTTETTTVVENTDKQESKELFQQYLADTIDTKNTNSDNLKKYHITQKISKSSAYVDKLTKVIIGVHDIDVFYKTSLEVTFPANSTIIEKVGAGKVFPFTKNGVKYQLIIIRVEYVYNYVEIQIEEK